MWVGTGRPSACLFAEVRPENNTGRVRCATLELEVSFPLAHMSHRNAGQVKVRPPAKRSSRGIDPSQGGVGVASILCLLAAAFELIIAVYLSDATC